MKTVKVLVNKKPLPEGEYSFKDDKLILAEIPPVDSKVEVSYREILPNTFETGELKFSEMKVLVNGELQNPETWTWENGLLTLQTAPMDQSKIELHYY